LPKTLRSMTGSGAGCRVDGAIQVQVELRSVNHRYLKISAHVPEELAWSQHQIEQWIRAGVERGSISVSIDVDLKSHPSRSVLDENRLETLWTEVAAVRDRIAPEQEIRISELLAIPGIVSTEDPVGDRDELLPVIEGAVDDAIAALREMQAREGEHLREELSRITIDLRASLSKVEEQLPATAEENRDRYRAKVQELLQGLEVEVEAGDLWREVAILAEKADVTEELGRLRGHLEQFSQLLTAGGRVGRRLDFLTQEMFREANTMTAKLNRYELSQEVVAAKAEIDRLREQIQNIE